MIDREGLPDGRKPPAGSPQRKAMKTDLILFNVAGIVVFGVWLGWHYLRALGRAFGTASPSSGPGDIGWVFIVVGIVGAACAAYSFFAPAGAARFVALAPLALILLAHGFIVFLENTRGSRSGGPEPGDREAQQQKLRGISRDYVRKAEPGERPEDPDGRNFSFLTHDREFNTIVLISDAYGYKIYSHCIGKIDGNFLDTWAPADDVKERYGRYVDSEGKTLFDRYTVRHRPDQDSKRSWLKKYKL